MIQYIGDINIIHGYLAMINCDTYVDNVRLTVFFDSIWWMSQYTCELQKLVNGIVWQLNI
jgi:hypothetical protein